MRTLDIAATVLFTIVSLAINATINYFINAVTPCRKLDSAYTDNFFFYLLITSTLVAMWVQLEAYAIVQLVRDKKAWWIPQRRPWGLPHLCIPGSDDTNRVFTFSEPENYHSSSHAPACITETGRMRTL